MGQVLSSILRLLCCNWKPDRSRDHHIGDHVDDDDDQIQTQLILPGQLQQPQPPADKSRCVDIKIDLPDRPSHGDGYQPPLAGLLSSASSDHNQTTITKTQLGVGDDTTSETLVVKKRMGPYTSSQMILLVGEGDFSFSACLAVAFGSASNMVATSLNSKGFLLKNYANFSANKKELVNRGCIVLHGIDATQMATHPQLSHMKFDRVVFNFPHSGFRSKETANIELGRHQRLVSGFLSNAKKMIAEDGQIHIRHKCNGNFLKWNIPNLAADQGLFLIQGAKFKLSKFPGYHTKYGFGGDKDFDCHPSKTYMFGLTDQPLSHLSSICSRI